MIGSRAGKEAEAFARALEGGGPANSEFPGLARFAHGLGAEAVEPSIEFLQSLRSELMTEAQTVLVKVPRKPSSSPVGRRPGRPVRRRLVAAATSLIAVAGVVGIVASSSQALPGDMLYPVKQGVENVELTLHRSDSGRGAFQLSQAKERLAEARSLAGRDGARNQELITKSLTAFNTKASEGARSLFEDYTHGGNTSSIEKVSSFASTSSSVLSDISGELPAQSADAFQQATSILTDLVTRAADLCDRCDVVPVTSLATTVQDVIVPKKAAAAQPKTAQQPRATRDPAPAAGTPAPTSASSPAPQTSTSKPRSPAAPAQPTQPADSSSLGKTVTGITTPLLGGLLGDDQQPGLIPGLLGGLLGTKSK